MTNKHPVPNDLKTDRNTDRREAMIFQMASLPIAITEFLKKCYMSKNIDGEEYILSLDPDSPDGHPVHSSNQRSMLFRIMVLRFVMMFLVTRFSTSEDKKMRVVSYKLSHAFNNFAAKTDRMKKDGYKLICNDVKFDKALSDYMESVKQKIKEMLATEATMYGEFNEAAFWHDFCIATAHAATNLPDKDIDTKNILINDMETVILSEMPEMKKAFDSEIETVSKNGG